MDSLQQTNEMSSPQGMSPTSSVIDHVHLDRVVTFGVV